MKFSSRIGFLCQQACLRMGIVAAVLFLAASGTACVAAPGSEIPICTGNDTPPKCKPAAPLPPPKPACVDGKPAGCVTDPKTTGNQSAAASENSNVPPKLIVSSVRIFHPSEHCNAEIATYLTTEGAPKPTPQSCGVTDESRDIPVKEGNILVSTGDIIIAVTGTTYDAAIAYQRAHASSLQVFFNGFNVKDDVHLVAAERHANIVFLQYHLGFGTQSKQLWMSLIRRGSLIDPAPLNVAFGWNPNEPTSEVSKEKFWGTPFVAVTTPPRSNVAVIVTVGMILLAVVAAVRTSMLRDSMPPEWLVLIKAAEQVRGVSADIASADLARKACYPAFDPSIKGQDLNACIDAAKKAIALDTPPPAGSEGMVVVGMAGSALAPADRTFSLARTQLFAWFLFTVSAGIYFQIIYGELPALNNTLLGFLGVSVGTAGLSWAVDNGGTQQKAQPSQGPFVDLVTGSNGDQAVHRFQAMAINVILLAVGIGSVIQQIEYPTIDNTWVFLLTISGAAYTMGKQLTEK